MKFTVIADVEVPDHDADLIPKFRPLLEDRFYGTAFTITNVAVVKETA